MAPSGQQCECAATPSPSLGKAQRQKLLVRPSGHRLRRPGHVGRALAERGRVRATGGDDPRQAPAAPGSAPGEVQGQRARHGPGYGPIQPAAQRLAPPTRGHEAEGEQRAQGGVLGMLGRRVQLHPGRPHGGAPKALHRCQVLRALLDVLGSGLTDARVGQRAAGRRASTKGPKVGTAPTPRPPRQIRCGLLDYECYTMNDVVLGIPYNAAKQNAVYWNP
jgi:hypothetical protein